MSEELKPCPFCGERLIERPETQLAYRAWHHPRGDCLMRDHLIVDDEHVDQAIAAWNARPSEHSAQSEGGR